jgi:hypothetical protein
VVLDRFDHDVVLEGGCGHLHASGAADCGVGDVAVAPDFVRGVDDDHALVRVVGEDAGDFAQHRRLADAGAPEEENAFAAEDEVFDDADGAVDGAADAQREADDLAAAVADAGDAVQRPFDTGAVVVAKVADVFGDVLEVLFGDLAVAEHDFAAGVARLREAAKVHDDFEQVDAAGLLAQEFADVGGQRLKQQIEVVGDDAFGDDGIFG